MVLGSLLLLLPLFILATTFLVVIVEVVRAWPLVFRSLASTFAHPLLLLSLFWKVVLVVSEPWVVVVEYLLVLRVLDTREAVRILRNY